MQATRVQIGLVILAYASFYAFHLANDYPDTFLVGRIFQSFHNRRCPKQYAPIQPQNVVPYQAQQSIQAPYNNCPQAYPTQQPVPQIPQQPPQRPQLNILKVPPGQPDLQAFNSLIGVDEAISAIKDTLELPLKYPYKVAEYRITPPKGVLFWGPPGTGKTSLARATAKYFACTFYSLRASELTSPLVGASEQNVRNLFADARANAPAVIFFDEIDAIGRKRDGRDLNRPSDLILNMLLAEMDGFESNSGLFVMGATNRKDVLDEALLRPGRFDRLIYIGLPGLEDRIRLWRLFLWGRPKAGNIDFNYLGQISNNFSPADIRAAVESASIEAAKRDAANGGKGIWGNDIVSAVEKIQMQQKRC